MRPCVVAFLLLVLASAPARAQRAQDPRDSAPSAAVPARLAPPWPRYEFSWHGDGRSAARFVPSALTESQEKTLSTLGLVLLGALTLWLLTR